jgi:hypothetical protein
MHANSGCNAKANKPSTVPHTCRSRLTAIPFEPTRSFPQALNQTSFRIWHALLGINAGLVEDSQFDRIHLKRMSEFVHRRFKRQQPRSFAWRAYVLAAQHVEGNQTMSR